MEVVIVGNGIAGIAAAWTIRDCCQKTTVTVISREFGPAYSACVLPNYIAGEIERDRVFIKRKKDYTRANIHTAFGEEVTAIDVARSRVYTTSRSFRYDRLILAVGSLPTLPTVQGISLKGVFTLKTLTDAEMILTSIRSSDAQKAIVIGAGAVAVEAAVALRKRGYSVSLLARSRLLRKLFDNEVALRIQEKLIQNGIEVFTGERVLQICGREQVETVLTNKRSLDCGIVLIATGMYPNTALVRNRGIEIGQTGAIKVDGRMQTNVEGIYAAGDCVETKDIITGERVVSMFWHNAKQQGRIAGLNALGVKKRYQGSFSIATLNVFGTHAISIGHTEAYVKQRSGDYEVIEKKLDRAYYRVITVNGACKGIQYIGPYIGPSDLGLLFMAARKGFKLEKVQNVSKLFFRNPWLCKVSNHLLNPH